MLDFVTLLLILDLGVTENIELSAFISVGGFKSPVSQLNAEIK